MDSAILLSLKPLMRSESSKFPHLKYEASSSGSEIGGNWITPDHEGT
jgi:hypothetical protein